MTLFRVGFVFLRTQLWRVREHRPYNRAVIRHRGRKQCVFYPLLESLLRPADRSYFLRCFSRPYLEADSFSRTSFISEPLSLAPDHLAVP